MAISMTIPRTIFRVLMMLFFSVCAPVGRAEGAAGMVAR